MAPRLGTLGGSLALGQLAGRFKLDSSAVTALPTGAALGAASCKRAKKKVASYAGVPAGLRVPELLAEGRLLGLRVDLHDASLFSKLALGCIETKLCDQIRILQQFSKSIFKTI